MKDLERFFKMGTFHIIICGGRTDLDYSVASNYIDAIFNKLQIKDAEIISGGAKGVDKIGEQYAEENEIPLKQFLPDWKKYGRKAGPIRNLQMLKYIEGKENPLVIAFWNGESKGTKFTIENAKKRGIPVYIIDYKENPLNEGITVSDGKLNFDFNHDNETDNITLTNVKLHSSTFNYNDYYYTYKINRKSDKKQRVDCLKALKHSPIDGDVKRMLDIAVKDILKVIKNNGINCIVYPQSSSNINRYLVENVTKTLDINVIEFKKKSPESVSFDWDAFLKVYHGTEERLVKFKAEIDKILERARKDQSVSLSKRIPPKFRKFINNLTIGNIDVFKYDNILIIDDIMTTGSTSFQIISLLRSKGYFGKISVFSLIYNRS